MFFLHSRQNIHNSTNQNFPVGTKFPALFSHLSAFHYLKGNDRNLTSKLHLAAIQYFKKEISLKMKIKHVFFPDVLSSMICLRSIYISPYSNDFLFYCHHFTDDNLIIFKRPRDISTFFMISKFLRHWRSITLLLPVTRYLFLSKLIGNRFKTHFESILNSTVIIVK